MARYRVHSNNGDGEIKIRPIDNGFIISIKCILSTKEVFVRDVDGLNEWLQDFYKLDKVMENEM
jgi:hypothetical protein